MFKNKIVIMDIDGTLADARHRVHYVQKDKDSGKRQWGKFFAAAKDDKPYTHTKLMNLLFDTTAIIIYLVTGRPENLRKDTEAWLRAHDIRYDALLMRPNNDRRPDYEAKKDLFEKDEVLSNNKENIVCVFEDRLQVAKMWRDLGLEVCVCGDDWLTGNWDK